VETAWQLAVSLAELVWGLETVITRAAARVLPPAGEAAWGRWAAFDRACEACCSDY